MTKLFSFACWNVEQFQGKRERVDRVVGLLSGHDPDVFAIFEVRGRDVFSAQMSRMPSAGGTKMTALALDLPDEKLQRLEIVARARGTSIARLFEEMSSVASINFNLGELLARAGTS